MYFLPMDPPTPGGGRSPTLRCFSHCLLAERLGRLEAQTLMEPPRVVDSDRLLNCLHRLSLRLEVRVEEILVLEDAVQALSCPL